MKRDFVSVLFELLITLHTTDLVPVWSLYIFTQQHRLTVLHKRSMEGAVSIQSSPHRPQTSIVVLSLFVYCKTQKCW